MDCRWLVYNMHIESKLKYGHLTEQLSIIKESIGPLQLIDSNTSPHSIIHVSNVQPLSVLEVSGEAIAANAVSSPNQKLIIQKRTRFGETSNTGNSLCKKVRLPPMSLASGWSCMTWDSLTPVRNVEEVCVWGRTGISRPVPYPRERGRLVLCRVTL